MIRGLSALLLAALIHLAACVSDAQELEGCYPVEIGSITVVSDRLSLDEDQTRWILKRFAAGTLRGPEDLEGMPGMGGDTSEPGYALWGAVVEGPGGPWFFKSPVMPEVLEGGNRHEAQPSKSHSDLSQGIHTGNSPRF